MKIMFATISLLLAGCTSTDIFSSEEAKQVQVLGRTWTVVRNPEKADAYVATRDNNNLQPFGKPVARRTPQAVRALEMATGCKVVRGTLWQNVSADFYADVTCPR